MSYHIVITDSARDDLYGIGDFISASAGELTSERFIEQVIEKISSLGFAPESFRVRQDFRGGIRVIHVKKYLVFYRVVESAVLILRVIHGARNITADMFPD